MSGQVIPENLNLANPGNQIRIIRTPVRQPSDVQSYTVNDKIIFNFPGNMSDFRHSYMTFFAQATANGGTYVRFVYPIQSCFMRARIYVGSQIWEDIDDFNVLCGMFELAKPYAAVNNLANEGTYDNTQRAADTAAGRVYQIRPRLQGLERVIPLNKIGSPLRLELTIDQTVRILEYDGSTPSGITFNQCFWNYHVLEVPDQYDSLLNDKINGGGFEISIHTWANQSNTSIAGNGGTMEIPFKYRNLTRIIAGYRLQSIVDSPTTNYKYMNQFLQRSISLSAAKINNKIYPSDKYDLALAQSYRQVNEVFNSLMESRFHSLMRAEDTFAGQDNTNRFILAFDIRKDNSAGDNLYDNGLDTSGSGSSLTLQLQFASSLAGNITVDAYGEYECCLKILPGGKVQISN